jgi:prophage regulatory protein
MKDQFAPRPRAAQIPDARDKQTSSTTARERQLASLPLRFLRFDAVRERTGLSRTTIWRLERKGIFPPHRQISANAVAWREDEVEAWMLSRAKTG